MFKNCMIVCAICLLIPAAAFADQTTQDSLRQDIESARKKVYPALVNISVVTRYYNGGRAQKAPAGGSGVIVSPDGVVLTNYHVAGNTTHITCTMTNGEVLDAKVVTHDPLSDLSVLRLNLDRRSDPKSPLPFASLGNSDALQVGDYVLAMGNPMMLSSSVTLGIVSNTKRVFTDFTGSNLAEMDLDEGEKTGLFTRWIQHDALILPGNSGGPLVNLKGEVVGINELGGGGVGFAIPSTIVSQILKQALEHGTISRGWLGLTFLPVSKLGRDTGTLISSVWPGSPAEKSKISPGDILLSINSEPATARFFEEIPLIYQRIASQPVGSSIKLSLLHKGMPETLELTIAPMERSLGTEEEERDMGVTVRDITDTMALEEHFPNKDGALVTGVRPGFPFEAAQPPIQPGDVILSVGGAATPNPDAFRKALKTVNMQEFVVAIRREKENLLTVVKVKSDKSNAEGTELPKAWLGVKTQVLTPEVAKAMHITDGKGFRITEVYPYTEAAKSGFKIGDIITAVNKDKLKSFRPQDSEDLKRLVEELSIGDKADVTILREGKSQKLQVSMEAVPTSSDQAAKSQDKEFEYSVRDILPMDRMEKSWKKDQAGVLVTDVAAGGSASIAGLQVDDLILAMNDAAIENIDQFDKELKNIAAKKPKIIQIFLRRDQQTHFVFIEPDWQKTAGK